MDFTRAKTMDFMLQHRDVTAMGQSDVRNYVFSLISDI